MRARRRIAVAALVTGVLGPAALGSGCAGRARPVATPPIAGEPSRLEPGRALYRVSYQGPRGGGSLRLALAVESDRYQMRASDAFGRSLWSLEVTAGMARLLDHRKRRHCVTSSDVTLPELALASLPLERLPVVLAGGLPAVPRPGSDPDDFLDVEGRRWTASRDPAGLAAWTLWREGRPLVWFGRQRQGGVLSHREGSQFRWRRTVAEPLDAPLTPLTSPPGYREADCESLELGESIER